ncbi:CocE/NonD family hydrolase [bacterium]|nr:CocE/NonD family hydrolase [bacterium]
MKRKYGIRIPVAMLLVTMALSFLPAFAAELSQPEYKVIEELDVMVAMRDGVQLSTNIYRPDAQGAFPALIMRTPYGNGGSDNQDGHFFAQRGYAVIIQDVRGRYESEGLFDAGRTEGVDGIDTHQWVVSQPWCNGRLGTFGGSYVGFTQWMPASLGSSHLEAMFATLTSADFHDYWMYQGGAFRLRSWTSWIYWLTEPYDAGREDRNGKMNELNGTLPLMEQDKLLGWRVSSARDWLAHPEHDLYWKNTSIMDGYKNIHAAVYNIGGWYDIFLAGTLKNYTEMTGSGIDPSVRKKQKLLVGPWLHGFTGDGKVGDLDYGKDAIMGGLPFQTLMLRLFDSALKGTDTGIMNEAPVRIFVMGSNVWRDEQEWPLARTQYRKWYFSSRSKANTLTGDGLLDASMQDGASTDTYTYDPADPVPSSTDTTYYSHFSSGPRDQQKIEERQDVLVYSSPELEKDMEVTGPVEAVVYAASTALNTDFTAKLVDVYPDGRAMRLCDGIIRASSRNPGEKPSNIEPGRVYEYHIDLWATSNVFKKGHRIRVEISSSNFPRFDRNLNTGEKFAVGTAWIKAVQTVYHTKEYPSHIVLPVIE